MIQQAHVSPVLVGGSGLKQFSHLLFNAVLGFSRPGGREWIETGGARGKDAVVQVSPVLVGGSGLKQAVNLGTTPRSRFLPSWWAGVD